MKNYLLKNSVLPIIVVFMLFCVQQINGQMNVEITKEVGCENESNGELKVNNPDGTKGQFQYSLWQIKDGKHIFKSSSSGNVFGGLEAGNYFVTVKDKETDCSFNLNTVNFVEGRGLSISIQGGGRFTFCDTEGPPTITLTASASGGEEPYSFEGWSGGQKEIRSSQPKQTLNVRDKNNCTGKADWSVEIVRVVCSRDPNDMIGPDGYGDPKFVSAKERLPYKIRFENDPEFASAPAQKVTVEHILDQDLNVFSLQLGNFGFANFIFEVQDKSSFYKKRLDLRDSLGIFVDVTAGIDITKNKVFWIFESIDSKTGLEPSDPLQGLLPVNDTITKKGEGFVDFTVVPKLGTMTGDSILAEAAIVFDVNETISTPEIFNVVDALPPISVMNLLPVISEELVIPISWIGDDDSGGSGIKDYTLFVSENDNAFYNYETGLTDTQTVFVGSPGSSYRFFVIATDNVGNVESKNTAETFTAIDADARLSIITLDQNNYCVGDSLGLQWASASINNLDILLSQDSGQTYTPLIENIAADTGLFKWFIPSDFSPCTHCFIKIVDVAEGSDLEDQVVLSINGIPTIEVSSDVTLCTGEYTQLQVNSFDNVVWTPSAGLSNNTVLQPIASPGESTTYEVVGTDIYGCQNSSTVTLTVLPSSTTELQLVACDSQEVGLVYDTLSNQFNCDSIIITNMVLDREPPIISTPSYLEFTIPLTGTLELTESDLQANISDNCGIDEITLSQSIFTCVDVGTQIIEVEVRDFAGLSQSSQVELNILPSNICNISISNEGGVVINAPCSCLNEGEFEDEITVISLPGETWQVLSTDLMDPETKETIQGGTTLTEHPDGSGLYRLRGVHLSEAGYTVTAESPDYTDFTITFSNRCYYPEISFAGLDELYCQDAENFILMADVNNVAGNGVFTIDGNIYDFFNPFVIGEGVHELQYTFDAGPALSDDPDDPGCISIITEPFEIKGIDHPICMGSGDFFSFSYNGPDTLYGNDECQATLDLGENIASVLANFSPEQTISDFTFNSALTGYNLGDIVSAGQTIPITYTAVDNYGNTNDFVIQLMVEDNLPPVALCRDITVVLDDEGVAFTTVDSVNNGSFDACGIESLSLNRMEFNTADLGVVPIEMTVTDVNGNSSNCSSMVTVESSTNTVNLPDFVSGVELFPNPTIDHVTIQLGLSQSIDLYYELLNSRGELIERHDEAKKVSQEYVKVIDLKNLPAGLYNLRVGDRKGEYFILNLVKIR